MADQITLEQLEKLPFEERLRLAEALWDSLAREPARVPVPDWHRELIRERIAVDDAEAGDTETWDEVRRQIEGRKA